MNPYTMLHDISDHYPIYLTVSKAQIKRDVKQRSFRDTSNVNIIAFDRDLHETYRFVTDAMKNLILL